MGDITKDILLCIAHLGALREHPHVESIVACDIAATTPTNPFTFAKLCTYLETEECLRLSKLTCQQDSSTALLSKTQKQGTTLHCSNCKKNGHTYEYCITPGGGMTGKSIEESRCARQEKFKGKNTQSQTTGQKEKVHI